MASLDHSAKKTLARPPTPNELLAREEHEHGVCFYGNHALCIHQRRMEALHAAEGRPPPYVRGRDSCPPVKPEHVWKCQEFLARGEWVDGRGSYGLKHTMEDELEARGEYGYASNGALLVAAFRLGLGVAWSHPDLNQPSPNARIYKLGKVPAAQRGAKRRKVA